MSLEKCLSAVFIQIYLINALMNYDLLKRMGWY